MHCVILLFSIYIHISRNFKAQNAHKIGVRPQMLKPLAPCTFSLMGSAPKCIFSLIFISIALFLFNSHLIISTSNPKSSNEVSTMHIVSRFRSLLGLKTHNNVTTKAHCFTALPPSPAPSQLVRKPLSASPVRAKPRASPLSHHVHSGPTQSFSDGNHGRRKTVVIAICLSLVILTAISIGIFILLWKKRPQNKSSQGKNKKVSIDPGPELFYLNSLTHYVETRDSSNHVKLSSETMQMESTFVSSPSHNGNEEVIVRCEGDNASCSDEETLSFHSARASDLSELPQHHFQASNSPSNSSYRSMSPMHRTNLRTIRFVASPFAQDLEADAFQNLTTQDSESFHKMSIPAISHPKISFLCNRNSQFPSTNASMSHGNSQSHVLMNLHACLGCKSMHIPSDSDPNSEIPSCSVQEVNLQGISPLKFTWTSEKASEKQSCSASVHALPYNSSGMHFPIISPPRASFVSCNKIQISKSKNSPSSQSQNTPSEQMQGCISVSNSKAVQSMNITLPKSGNITKPPPPPPPPPLPPRKNTMHQKPCNNDRFLAPPDIPARQLEVHTKNAGPNLPKLKPLHWDKVRAAPDRSMVWDKIRSTSFEFDEKMIESLFGYNSKSVLKHEEAKSKSPSPSKHVLEHKRLQNITILLKALNATTDQVCNAIIKGRGLSVQQLEALVKMAPTKEEEENLIKYRYHVEEVDPAENFVKEVLRIPFAFAKIETMLYKETFQDEVSHLRNSFAMLEEACKELKSSQLFLRLLEAVLKTGNRMNVGTTRGDARAFKLDALLKLADVKGTDGRTTLLHFVVQEINKPKPGEEKIDKEISGLDLVSGLGTELSNVKKTASTDLDVLIGSVKNLSLGLCKLKQLVQSDSCVDDLNSTFLQSMEAFMQNAEKVIQELKNEEKEVLIHVREITEYYHGDLSKEEANPLRIFVIVRDFLGMLDRVCKELRQPKMHSVGPQLVMLNR
ncbi:Formin-like protein [Rhynchospora pubera]|uniref:Formin-like protein n=1 Tax=Rhynchospora pubera TaxID=906938 RepID=A0AAV8DFC4_9POAL|nr:Formin-like protein [Rhynchospora pubera]